MLYSNSTSFTHSPPPHSLAHSPTPSPVQSLSRSSFLTHSLTHSLTPSLFLTHTHTHSLSVLKFNEDIHQGHFYELHELFWSRRWVKHWTSGPADGVKGHTLPAGGKTPHRGGDVPGQRAASAQPLVLYVTPQDVLGPLEQHGQRHPGDETLLRR